VHRSATSTAVAGPCVDHHPVDEARHGSPSIQV
jgi:hypothetical protein